MSPCTEPGPPTDYDFRWLLEETSGTVAEDASPNNRDGTITGGVSLGQPSLKPNGSGSSYQFDGSSGLVERAKEAWMNTSSWTIAIWLKWSSLASNQNWLTLNDNPGGAGLYILNLSNQINIQQALILNHTFTPTIAAGTVYHLAISHDQSTGDGFLYLDGVAVASYSMSPGGSWNRAGSLGIKLGKGFSSYSGHAQDFQHFSRALTADEVACIYEEGVEPPSTPPTTPTNVQVAVDCVCATVTWDASEDAPTGYEIRIDGGTPVDVGDVLEYEVCDLEPGTEYTVEVRAYNDDGDSGWSDSVEFTTDVVPGSVGSISLAAGTTTVTATWPPVAAADYYEVRIDGGTTVTSNDTSHGFTGLTPGTAHTVEVRACNGCGCSEWTVSEPVTTLTQIVASTCPCGPRWVIEACDLATGRIRAILNPIAADWQTILTGLGTGSLTFPTRAVAVRDIWPDLTSIYISRIADDGSYDCQYAAIPEKLSAKSTLEGGTTNVGLQPIESYWWRRFLDTDRTYTGVLQTQIAASLTSYAAANGIPLTGVADSSVYALDRTYVGAERPFIGAQLDLLAQAENGIEWTVLHTRANGHWSTRVLFQDRAGNDLDTIFQADVDGADYGLEVDAANHATYVDGFGDDPASTRIISNATDNGPYVRFDAAPSFGTVLDAMNNQQQTDGYLIENREPVATPTFVLVGDDPDPTGVRLGDTGTFHMNLGAVRFNGRARIGSISSRIAEGQPWTRTLGLAPIDRASNSVLNQ